MPASADPRVDAYIAKSAVFARPILNHLRRLVHAACPAVEETIKWGMPSFVHAGGILCGMAAFKAHCTLGFWHQGMAAALEANHGEAQPAMGSFGRLTCLADLPNDATMLRYLRQAVKLNESGAPARPRPASKPKQVAVPADFAAALKKNPPAAATFEKFSPSHRREYVEWITEAKRVETRQTRLATALEWLAAGKSRNWKYENC